MNLSIQTETTLMEYGLLNQDRSFCSKLSSLEIEQFLKGEPLCATSGKERLTFHFNPHSREVSVRESTLEKSLSYLRKSSHTEFLQLVKETTSPYFSTETSRYEKKAYLKDSMSGELVELDVVKHLSKIGKEVLEKGDIRSRARYRTELYRLKNYYLKQMKKYPENAKDFKGQLLLVSKEISKVSRSVKSLSEAAEPKVSRVSFEKEPERSPVQKDRSQTESLEANKSLTKDRESHEERKANSSLVQLNEKLEVERNLYPGRRRR